MVHAARTSGARATPTSSSLHLLIDYAAIRNARNSPENNALNFSNRLKTACVRAPFSRALRSKNHNSPVTYRVSRFTDHQSLLTNRAFLIATRPELKIELTPSQQTRKHFLIATFSAISAPAPHLADHGSRIEPFLFDTNKPHKITILVSALMKTKEKQFSIRYKFAPREVRSVSHVAGMKSVGNFRGYRNAACLAVPVVLTCPAASGPNWFAWLGMGA